jgi:hypothetical protein
MKTTQTRTGPLTRLGKRLGRACARTERRAAEMLMACGLSATGAKALAWIVKLALICVLLYVAGWIVLMGCCLFCMARAPKTDFVSEKSFFPEWRHGPSGYGLYGALDMRLDDPTDPDDFYRF